MTVQVSNMMRIQSVSLNPRVAANIQRIVVQGLVVLAVVDQVIIFVIYRYAIINSHLHITNSRYFKDNSSHISFRNT